MSQLILDACVPGGQTSGTFACEVFEVATPSDEFTTINVIVSSKMQSWKFTDRNMERVRSVGEVKSIAISGPSALVALRERSLMTCINIVSASEVREETLQAVITQPNLHACLLGDYEDRGWQMQRSVEAYKRAGRDYSHAIIDEDHPLRLIDVSGNPGRWSTIPGLVLWPAAHMWLGPVAIEYYGGLDHLLAFGDVPVRVVNGLVELELYDVDDPEELIRERQRSFRDWVGMDDLETNPDRWLKTDADPAVHLDRKIVDGVERTIMTQWFDADGELTKRSKAVIGRRAVIADDGVQISSTEIAP